MAIDLWSPLDLFELRQDDRMNALPSWILDTFFTQTHFSQDKSIKFADLPENDRYLAPFVLPYDQGKPLDMRRGYSVEEFMPAYIKLKNAVRPSEARIQDPRVLLSGRQPSLVEKFDQRVAEITEAHLRAIRVREIWMAVRAFVDAKVQIDYDRDQGASNPSVLLDFGRDPGQTVTLASGFWNDPAADILGDLESWMNTMYLANGGGTASMLIVGAQVAPLFKKNNGIKAALDRNYRHNDSVQIDLGIMRTERPLQRIGQLDNSLEVFAYKDTIDIPNGSGGKTKIDLFNEKDILLVAPGANGVRAYGAIYDADAIEGGQALSTDIFGKMFKTNDPGELFVMHQSSPLPIPLYPNRTFKARVLA